MQRRKRIICYAINGSGLGHLTRLIATARWMRRCVALLDHCTPEILFLTSSDASDALADAKFAAFKIPSKTVAVRSQLNKLEYKRLAKHFVWNTLGVFSPDLLVVDTFPAGSFDELFQVLDGPFKKSFIHRDVKPEYAARPTFRAALRMYDQVVSPHRAPRDTPVDAPVDAPCLRSSNGHSHDSDATLAHTGEVVQFDAHELLSAAVARQQLGVAPGRRLVYLSAGGGGDPHAQQTLTSLIDALREDHDLHLLIGAGPLYRGPRLAGPHLSWFDAADVWRYFGALDAAISAGGYNTFHELLLARVPTLFFAQEKIADDQRARIQQAAAAGAGRELTNPREPLSVSRQLRELFQDDVAAAMRAACVTYLPDNGAFRCAIELLRPLYDANQLHWAAQLLVPSTVFRLEAWRDGAADVLPAWLAPLLPQTQFATLTHDVGLQGILARLSPDAADEVEQLLAERPNDAHWSAIHRSLQDLLDAIDAVAGVEAVVAVADEVLRTLLLTLKKHATLAISGGSAASWRFHVVTAIDAVRSLIEMPPTPLTVTDTLRLFRMLPRIADTNAVEASELFHQFVQQRLLSGELPHTIMQQLQVLKMTEPDVTRETLTLRGRGVSR